MRGLSSVRTTRRRRPADHLILALVAALGLVGCGDSEEPSLDPPRSDVPAPQTTPAKDAEASKRALAAYEGYRQAAVTASNSVDQARTDLAKYVSEPLLGQVLDGIRETQANGIIFQGKPRWSPKVTAVRLQAAPATADITDCYDITGYKPVYRATGKSAAAPNQPQRFRILSRVKLIDGRWYVYESTARRDTPC
jgi:hypothetical protein